MSLNKENKKLRRENEVLRYTNQQLRKRIKELKEEAEGREQLQDVLLAVLEGIVLEMNPTKENPVTVSRDVIGRIMQNGTRTIVSYSGIEERWMLWLREEQEQGGE